MSYIAYINGNQLELLDEKDIAYTKQVNDLARLDNRQSNFTHKFVIPFTAVNKKAMEFVYFVGNQSNVPYQKNVFDLIDANSNEHLIYKGWATISQTIEKGYEINVYDGNVDFYKAIENKSLTDTGISELNHLKNLTSVIDSFTNPALNYKYIIGDYNGKNTFISISTSDLIGINIDYQVPSARNSYLLDKIFQYAGFTYSGSVFSNPKFLNWWMTYPKPVPTLEPIIEIVSHQDSIINSREIIVSSGSGTFTSTMLECYLLPDAFTNVYGNNLSGGTPNPLLINITQTGSYRIKCSGSLTNAFITSGIITWRLYTGVTLISSGTFDAQNNESVTLAVTAGQKITLTPPFNSSSSPSTAAVLSGGFSTAVDLILGYDANFEAVLIDFSIVDFVNEFMQRFGLTMFKDKYSKHLDFLTLKEILESNNIEDWSSKFIVKGNERYILSNYGQKNRFKYKYNDDNDSFNDGFINISNVNIPDEKVLIQSKIYSPDKGFGYVGGLTNLFRIWNKEVKDDGTLAYKELTGRFYFMREKLFNSTVKIGSEALNTQTSITSFPVTDFSRLKFQDIIEDNYPEIESILDKSKLIEAYFYLKPIEVAKFDFKKLIFIEQLASYYLVNKIVNFIKGQKTKCEIIEVDYKKTIEIVPLGTYITILSVDTTDCDVTFTIETDFVLPIDMQVYGTANTFGFPVFEPLPFFDEIINITTTTVTITLPAGQYWQFIFRVTGVDGTITSNVYSFNNSDTCTVPGPELDCDPESIVISNLDKFNVGSPEGGALDNRSGWTFDKVMSGVTFQPSPFGIPSIISTLCMPYSYRVEINSSLGLQTVTHLVDGLTMGTSFDSFSITTDGRPTSGTFQLFYINSLGTEFASNILTF